MNREHELQLAVLIIQIVRKYENIYVVNLDTVESLESSGNPSNPNRSHPSHLHSRAELDDCVWWKSLCSYIIQFSSLPSIHPCSFVRRSLSFVRLVVQSIRANQIFVTLAYLHMDYLCRVCLYNIMSVFIVCSCLG